MASSVFSLSPDAPTSARPLRVLSLKPVVAGGLEAVRRISSQMLLKGGRELVIQHEGSEYHLRLTRNGKLILTK